MPHGLRVLSATGQVLFDTSDRACRLLGLVPIDDGEVTDDRLSAGDVWASAVRVSSDKQQGIYGAFHLSGSSGGEFYPTIFLSGNTLFWFPDALTPTAKIVYGIR